MTNLQIAKNLNKSWIDNCTTRTSLNHVDWVQLHNLSDGPRFLKNLPVHIEKRIAAIKAYLKETTTHAYSGAIYGDMKKLVTEKWQDRKWGQKNSQFISDERLQTHSILFTVWNSLPKGKTVVSGMFVKFYNGEYHLFSSNPHFTRCTGMKRYSLLWSSRHFISVLTIEPGSPEYLSYGFIKEVIEP